MFNPVPPASDPAPAPAVEAPAARGSVRLFRLAGTDVYVHWSWFVAAYYLLNDRPVPYSSRAWDVVEYVAGFGLVLLHEFGHVLACRQVGGAADRVVLWPLGGLAFVTPPARPGADLWTTAAGPLVNVVLAPVLVLLAFQTAPAGEDEPLSDANRLCVAVMWFNAVMLAFNLLPIYPLDGGRILQAVLWRFLGRGPALAVAAGLGFVAALGLGALAVTAGEWWLAAMAGFLALGAYGGLAQSRVIARLAETGRRPGLACPTCGAAPPVGDFWRCARCLGSFDALAPPAACPKGGTHATETGCPECGRPIGPAGWVPAPAPHPPSG